MDQDIFFELMESILKEMRRCNNVPCERLLRALYHLFQYVQYQCDLSVEEIIKWLEEAKKIIRHVYANSNSKMLVHHVMAVINNRIREIENDNSKSKKQRKTNIRRKRRRK